ncbi:hypothetical protein CKO15_09100 [Halorhodospira abdelmalekii]|uniref:ATP-binding protein n=1 Tax=Halorhodospira abdelmalekii TaxID=421629 RepID=UPI001906A881|nr:ATP-binding protein [Halorhodospira abdelmalekii]MBK1735436.1 hypothetical protein [Halorhodospira abdelmalekii]
MNLRFKIPFGVQSFEQIRTDGYYYVDKTELIQRLTESGSYFFLNRPKCFGKSLLLDTLKSLFEGREALFRGLYIHDHWDWSIQHPVIRLSFSNGVPRSREELDERIHDMLNTEARLFNLTFTSQSIAGRFRELIQNAHELYDQRAVVLIDEYDRPILDNFTEPQRARELRDGLNNLYSVLKDADPHLHFVLLTGVSQFSTASLFSGLNNLNDITLNREYATICGYTDEDINTIFAPELPGLNRVDIRRWYNGYRWGDPSATPAVYNPFDVLLLLQKREFHPYWFESATPTFLVELLAERGIFTPQLERLQSEASLLGRFDVDDTSSEALLFQTGCLTVHRVEQPLTGYWLYTLGYPNQEVKTSLNRALLPKLGIHDGPQQRLSLFKALKDHNVDALGAHIKGLFASLPHEWYRNNPIAQYEGHYASVFYSHFAALGVDVTVEDASSTGWVDMTVDFDGHLHIFEFKVVEQAPEGKALQQLRDKEYTAKYFGHGKPIHLVGFEFSREQRAVVAFEWETLREVEEWGRT